MYKICISLLSGHTSAGTYGHLAWARRQKVGRSGLNFFKAEPITS